jgi:hypothetical protein
MGGVVAVVAALAASCGGGGAEPVPGAAAPSARYCETVARFADLDLLVDEDPAAVRDDLRDLLALTRAAARVAPRAVRADADAAVTVQRRFNALYASHGWDPEATNRDPEFIAYANSPEVGSLYVRLQDYQRLTCGPDPSTTDPDSA